MSDAFPYDGGHEPPAPVLPIVAGPPDGSRPGVLLRALVDTGADITVIPAWLLDQLELRVVDAVPVSTPAGTARAPVVGVRLQVAHDERTVHVLALGDEPLVGRDLLNSWVVTLDGPAGRLDISDR